MLNVSQPSLRGTEGWIMKLGKKKNGQECDLEQLLEAEKQKNQELQGNLDKTQKENEELQSKLDEALQRLQKQEDVNEEQEDETASQETESSSEQQSLGKDESENEAKDTESEEQQTSSAEAMDNIQSKCQRILEKLACLEDGINAVRQLSINMVSEKDNKIEEYIDKYDRLLDNVQQDRYLKDKLSLVKRIISYVELVREVLYEFDEKRGDSVPLTKDAVFFREQIENLTKSMAGTIRNEMVETIPMANMGDDFDEKRMDVIDTVETDNPSLNRKIFRSVSPCYIWSLPYILKARVTDTGDEVRSYKFVLQPEKVILYNLKK